MIEATTQSGSLLSDEVNAPLDDKSGDETAVELLEEASTNRPRALSVLQTARDSHEVGAAGSPTTRRVPMFFKRLPLTPRSAREATVSPIAGPSSSPLTTPKTRHVKNKSSEFSSREFRPLYLVQSHTPVKPEDFIPEDTLPSLPLSRTTSVSGSTENLPQLVKADETTSDDEAEGESSRGRSDRRHSWQSADESRPSADFLDSRSTTPVPGEQQRAREQQIRERKEVPKYLFHSPSELLQDPSFNTEISRDDIELREESPLPSVASTADDQDFMSAASQPDTPTMPQSPPSRADSPFKHRTSSNIFSRAAALFGGAALGLAISGVANKQKGGSRDSSETRSDTTAKDDSYITADDRSQRPTVSITEPTPVDTVRTLQQHDFSPISVPQEERVLDTAQEDATAPTELDVPTLVPDTDDPAALDVSPEKQPESATEDEANLDHPALKAAEQTQEQGIVRGTPNSEVDSEPVVKSETTSQVLDVPNRHSVEELDEISLTPNPKSQLEGEPEATNNDIADGYTTSKNIGKKDKKGKKSKRTSTASEWAEEADTSTSERNAATEEILPEPTNEPMPIGMQEQFEVATQVVPTESEHTTRQAAEMSLETQQAEVQESAEGQTPWDFGLSDKQRKKKEKAVRKEGTWNSRITKESLDTAALGKTKQSLTEFEPEEAPATFEEVEASTPVLESAITTGPGQEVENAVEEDEWAPPTKKGRKDKRKKKSIPNAFEQLSNAEETKAPQEAQATLDEPILNAAASFDTQADPETLQTISTERPHVEVEPLHPSSEATNEQSVTDEAFSTPLQLGKQEDQAGRAADRLSGGDATLAESTHDASREFDNSIPSDVLDTLTEQTSPVGDLAPLQSQRKTDSEAVSKAVEDSHGPEATSMIKSSEEPLDEHVPVDIRLAAEGAVEKPMSETVPEEESVAPVNKSVDGTPVITEDDDWLKPTKKSKKDKRKRKSSAAVVSTYGDVDEEATQAEAFEKPVPAEITEQSGETTAITDTQAGAPPETAEDQERAGVESASQQDPEIAVTELPEDAIATGAMEAFQETASTIDVGRVESASAEEGSQPAPEDLVVKDEEDVLFTPISKKSKKDKKKRKSQALTADSAVSSDLEHEREMPTEDTKAVVAEPLTEETASTPVRTEPAEDDFAPALTRRSSKKDKKKGKKRQSLAQADEEFSSPVAAEEEPKQVIMDTLDEASSLQDVTALTPDTAVPAEGFQAAEDEATAPDDDTRSLDVELGRPHKDVDPAHHEPQFQGLSADNPENATNLPHRLDQVEEPAIEAAQIKTKEIKDETTQSDTTNEIASPAAAGSTSTPGFDPLLFFLLFLLCLT